MSLEATIFDIIACLRQGRFPNEQRISLRVDLRALQELCWSTWEITIVWPTYPTGKDRVNFANENHKLGRLAVKPVKHLGDEVMKAFKTR